MKPNSSTASSSGTELRTQNHTDLKKRYALYTASSDTTAQTTTSTPIRLAPGRTPISAPLDLTRYIYINSVYGAGHFVTHVQADGTYHIYRDILIGHIPEIRYDSDRKCFEPRDIHINLRSFERMLEEYRFLSTFAEDPEIPEHESEEIEKFSTPPESPQPKTP